MRKKLLMLLTCMMAFVLPALADTLYDLAFGPNLNSASISGYTKTFTVESNQVTFELSAFNNNSNGGGNANKAGGAQVWEFVRCGSKNATSTATITSKSELPQAITEVVINAKKNKSGENDKATSAELLVSSTSDFTNAKSYSFDVNSLTTAESDITIAITEPLTDQYYQIKIVMPQNTNNGWLQVNTVKFNGNNADDTRQEAELAFPEAEYNASLTSVFAWPVATAKSNGAISYVSSNPAVATVDAESGKVTLVAAGTTTITATIAATDEYKSGKAEYTLTVVNPLAPAEIYASAMGVDFEFTNAEGQTYPWSHDKAYGLKGSAYVSGKTNACEGIAASPVIDLTNQTSDIVLTFDQAFNNYKVKSAMILVADFKDYAFVVVKEEGAEEWEVLAEPTAPKSFSWTFYANAPISLKAYAGKKIQLGFKYVSTAECAGTWEIKNIKVIENTELAIMIDGKDAHGVAFDENTEVVLTAPNGATIYYQWFSEEIATQAEEEAVDFSEYEKAPSNPFTLTVGENKGKILRVGSSATGNELVQLLFNADGVTRIETVEAETNAPAEWFDLQGRRVAEPAQGLYIRRQGRTATKVLVK